MHQASTRSPVQLGVVRIRVLAQRGVMDRGGELVCPLDIMPWAGSVGTLPRLNRGDHLHVVDRPAGVPPLHIRDQGEVEAAIRKHRDSGAYFTVVEPLQNELKIQVT